MAVDIYVLIQQSRVLQERELEEAGQGRRGRPREHEADQPLWRRLAARLRSALLRRQGLRDRVGIAECLIMFAGVTAGRIKTAAEGQSTSLDGEVETDAQRVARLLGAAETLLETTGTNLEPRAQGVYERATAIGKEQLGEQGFETARRLGRAMTPDEAIAYALEGVDEQRA